MVSVKWFNEKGNVSVKVRDGVRSQVKAVFKNALESKFGDVVENANGGFSVAVAEIDGNGSPIYAHFEFKVSDKLPADIGEKKKGKAKKSAEVVIPDLFVEAEDNESDEDAEE